jgi:hypothetical protein
MQLWCRIIQEGLRPLLVIFAQYPSPGRVPVKWQALKILNLLIIRFEQEKNHHYLNRGINPQNGTCKSDAIVMKTTDVKTLVQQAASEAFSRYPDSFPLRDGIITSCCTENISQWAINMWESRPDEEIARDFHLGLNADNYMVWAFEAFRNTYL